MALLYRLPKAATGMLVATFCDEASNQFIDLAAWSFKTDAEFRAAWASIPVMQDSTAFILDNYTVDGIVDNRAITGEWVERQCGKPLAELIAAGRKKTTNWIVDWKAARAIKSHAHA